MWLISPLSWLLLALLLAPLALRLRSRARWPWRACLATASVATIAMTPLVANSLLGHLERPGPVAPECHRHPPSTVVVLAGGWTLPPRSAHQFSVLNLASRRRLDGALRYWRDDPHRRIVLSGGAHSKGAVAHADVMAAYMRWAGVPSESMRLEERSRTTWENAQRVAALASPGARRIVLVTSAMHMPRARFAFRSAGFVVCPLPVDPRLNSLGPPGYLIPRVDALIQTEDALHELVGLGYYRLLEWWNG